MARTKLPPQMGSSLFQNFDVDQSSSRVLVHHHNFASPKRYMVVIVIYSFARIWATLKYCSMSQRKFSKSFVFHLPLKGLGSATRNFDGDGSKAKGPATYRFVRSTQEMFDKACESFEKAVRRMKK